MAIRQKEEGFYLLNVDPLSEEITSILVKSEFLSADVLAIFK